MRAAAKLIMFGGVCASACAAVLGIEEKPLRQELRDSEIDDASGGVDGPPADSREALCQGRPPEGCLCGPPHDFCSDFDRVVKVHDEWKFIDGFPLPLVQGGATLELTTSGEPLTKPNALKTEALSSGSSSIAVLLHALVHDKLKPGKTFQGARYKFGVRIATSTFGDAAAGPVPGIGTAPVAAMFLGVAPAPKQKGVLLLTSSQGFYLATMTDTFGDKGVNTNKSVGDGTTTTDWITFEMLIADRDRAVVEGFGGECAGEDPGLVVAVRGKIGSACMTLPTELSSATEWGAGFAVTSGGGTFGEGNLSVYHDNLSVDFLE